MNSFKKLKKGFIIGVIGTIIFSSISFADPYKKQLDVVYNNIKVIVKGKEAILTEEPFILEGRTYVPLRAVAELLGETVEWDGSNYTVIIGEEEVKQKKEGVVGIAEGILVPYRNFSAWISSPSIPVRESPVNYNVLTATNETRDFKDHIFVRQEKYDLNNALYQVKNGGRTGQTYLLNSDYTRMTANFAVDDSMVRSGTSDKSTVTFYGDGNFLGEYTARYGDAPQSIELDLVGIEEFKIIIGDYIYGTTGVYYGMLYDLNFYEIKK